MTTVEGSAVQIATERLTALADGLAERGFATQIVWAGADLCLRVANRAIGRLSEDVRAGRAVNGSWWFWWSWAEPITLVEDIDAAAVKIAHVLTPRHDR
jgi:hypothetical protein